MLISSGATVTLIVDRFTEERLTEGGLTVDWSTADRLTTKSIMNGENNMRTGQLQTILKWKLDRVTVNGELFNSGQVNRGQVSSGQVNRGQVGRGQVNSGRRTGEKRTG